MESGATNTLWAKVMARQPASEWVVLERCSQEAKNG